MTTTVLGIADGRALGGLVRIVVTRPDRLAAARGAVEEVLSSIDAAASRFREDSELNRLNASPGREVVVSHLLAQAIQAGLRGAELTAGAVDPTVGHAVRLAGYDTDFGQVPPDGAAIRLIAHRVPGWQAVELNRTARTVRIPRGVEIDLGATAKALASDLAAAAASRALDGAGALVSLGGDISVAGTPPVGGWSIQACEDSCTPVDEDAEAVSITSGGVATSSTTVRRWTRGGVSLHHIIDPATGLPVDSPWRTATVVAGSCLDANIASTAAIVMGAAAIRWLETHSLPARLVDRSGMVSRVAGWPDPISGLSPKIL